MAAPEAPPVAPASAPESAPQPGIAAPADPTSPEVSQEAGDVQEGEQEAGTGFDLAGLLKDASPDELRQVFNAVPEETRNTALAEELRRAEQRGAERQREELEGRTARSDFYQQGIDRGRQAADWLMQTAQSLPSITQQVTRALDFEDTATAKQHLGSLNGLPQGIGAALQDARIGATLEASQRLSAELNQFIASKSDVIGKLEDGEMKKLSELAYNDGRTGTNKTQMALFDLMLERAEARGEQKGIEKGLKDKDANIKLAEKLGNLAAAKADGAPRLNGTAGAGGERATLQRDIKAFDPSTMPADEARTKLAELQKRAKKLG